MAKATVEYRTVGKAHAKGWARFQEEPFKELLKKALQIAKQGYCYYVDDLKEPCEVCRFEVDRVIIDLEQRDIEIWGGSLFTTDIISNKKEALKLAKN